MFQHKDVAEHVLEPKTQQTGLERAITSPLSIEQVVRQSAIRWGLNQDYFAQVARCESNFNPSSINYGYTAGGGHPTGLFQFLPETWDRMSRLSELRGDIWNAYDNANLAGWAFSNGHSGEWACK